MRVLLVDSSQYAPVTPLFADSLGPTDLFFDESPYVAQRSKLRRLLGQHAGIRAYNAVVLRAAAQHLPDVMLVVKGSVLRPQTLARIKAEIGTTVVCFATDDLQNWKVSTPEMRASVREYDLYCTPRRLAIPDILRAGCPRTEQIFCGFHPSLHYPPPEPWEPQVDVVLVGGADKDRLPFARALAALPIRFRVLGGGWQKHPEFRQYALGVRTGPAFREALWNAKVVVCVNRRANRDEHKMLTFEAPACRAATVFEDSEDHRQLFGALNQNIFFTTPEDLVRIVRFWLGQPAWRNRLAGAECTVVRQGHHSWQDRFQQIMELAQEIRDARGILNVRA